MKGGAGTAALTVAASTAAIGLSTETVLAQQQSMDRFDGLANLPFEQNH